MFNFSQITETIGDLMGQGADATGSADGLLQQIGDLGFEPTQLAELAPDELMTLLGDNGIDLSQFDVSQLAEQLGDAGPLAEVLELASGRGP